MRPTKSLTDTSGSRATPEGRDAVAKKGKRLQHLSIAWNSIEAGVGLLAAVSAGSTALLAFGVDSLIEVASSVAVVWRLSHDSTPSARERAERISLRVIGACFIALSLYVAVDAIASLMSRRGTERSMLGILVSIASLIVMPLLARAKRKIASGLSSRAMRADARQTDLCAYLAAILLAGLALNAVWGLVVG